MRRGYTLVSLFIVLIAGRCGAEVLTLDACRAAALANNNGLKAAREEALASAADVAGSKARFLPRLSAEGTYRILDQSERMVVKQNSFGGGLPPDDEELSIENQQFYGVDLVLRQPLYTGGELTHRHRQSELLQKSAEYLHDRRERELLRDVELVFNRALNARLYTEMLEKAVAAKRERLRVLQSLAGEGYVGRENYLEQKSDLQLVELELSKSRNSSRIFLRELSNILGGKYETDELQLQGQQYNGTCTAPLVELTGLARKNRDELKAAKARLEGLVEEIAAEKGGFMPQLALEGRYTQQKETTMTRESMWGMSAQFEWSIFSWGETNAAVKKKEALWRVAKYQTRDLENRIVLEAETCWYHMREAEESVAARLTGLKAAQFKGELIAARYRQGDARLVELVESEAEQLRAYHQYLIAINNFGSSLAHLEAAVSESLKPWLVEKEIYRPKMEFTSRSRLGPKMGGEVGIAADNSENRRVIEQQARQVNGAGNTSKAGKVQVIAGSFRSLEYAEERRQLLLPHLAGQTVSITSGGLFHVVLVRGFTNAEDAVDTMVRAGCSDYVVKENHEL